MLLDLVLIVAWIDHEITMHELVLDMVQINIKLTTAESINSHEINFVDLFIAVVYNMLNGVIKNWLLSTLSIHVTGLILVSHVTHVPDQKLTVSVSEVLSKEVSLHENEGLIQKVLH